jgi:hypothetical protein
VCERGGWCTRDDDIIGERWRLEVYDPLFVALLAWPQIPNMQLSVFTERARHGGTTCGKKNNTAIAAVTFLNL